MRRPRRPRPLGRGPPLRLDELDLHALVRAAFGLGLRDFDRADLFRGRDVGPAAGLAVEAFGLTGPYLAINSACASSLQAMLLGARALQLGHVDMAIVGGASVELT